MNYGGDAADQIVRYSMEGMEHTLRISGSIAKNLAVLIVAVLKEQKKTRGKTSLLRMLKEQRAMKFFTIPHDRLREFAGEAKSRGLLYVVIRDKKNPQFSEIMVFADDAAKVNRVLDKTGNRACDRCRIYRENRSKRRASGENRNGGIAGRHH